MNYCEILGVTENSSLEEIKKAYKKLALQYHPDISPKTKDKFLEIHQAYEYALKVHGRNNNPNTSMDDMFFEMFKFIKSATVKQRVIKLNLTIQEVLKGEVKKDLDILFDAPCSCSVFTKSVCPICRGLGFIQEKKSGTFVFSNISKQNQNFVYRNFYKDITLVIKINILSDGFFKIRNNVVESEEKLNIFKSILGGSITVKTLLGREVIEIPKGSISNFMCVLKGKGLFGGDHTIRFNLFLPDNLNDTQKELLTKLV